MKKLFRLLLAAMLIISLCACDNNKTVQGSSKSTDSDSVRSSTAVNGQQTFDGIDVDLTKLSSTMVYSEVYNMMNTPSEYLGKTVKMNGQFSYYEDPNTKNKYFACIIADATACCQQGLEFELNGKHIYPDDYPELGSEITVTGIFEVYTENNAQYCRLTNATMAS